MCELYDRGYSSSFDDIMDTYGPGSCAKKSDDFFDDEDEEPPPPSPPSPLHRADGDAVLPGEDGERPKGKEKGKGREKDLVKDTVKDKAPVPAPVAQNDAHKLIPAAIYVISGVMLVFAMEQFIQIGMRMRQF